MAGGKTTGASAFGIYNALIDDRMFGGERYRLMMQLYRLESPQNELRFHAKDVTTEEWVLIGKMAWLRRLDVSKSNLDDQSMIHLAKLQNLETLVISDTRITAGGLSALGEMPKLKSLYIERCLIHENSLKIWSDAHPMCFPYYVLSRMLKAPKPEIGDAGVSYHFTVPLLSSA